MPIRIQITVEPGVVDPTQFPHDLVVQAIVENGLGSSSGVVDYDVQLDVSLEHLEVSATTEPAADSRHRLIGPSADVGYVEMRFADVPLGGSTNQIRVPVKADAAPVEVPMFARAESKEATSGAPAGTLYGFMETLVVPSVSMVGAS